jgi:A118 family predicted phage portal protein
MKIEDQCCLSRGTLSDPNDIARTATEMKIMKQRSYATVSDIQEALGDALNDLVYAMYCLSTLYELAPDGEYETSFTWDDSIITDADTEREVDRQDVRDGFMLPYEYRMKWYGEDEKTAKKKLAELEESEPDDDELLGFGNPNEEPEPEEGKQPEK